MESNREFQVGDLVRWDGDNNTYVITEANRETTTAWIERVPPMRLCTLWGSLTPQSGLAMAASVDAWQSIVADWTKRKFPSQGFARRNLVTHLLEEVLELAGIPRTMITAIQRVLAPHFDGMESAPIPCSDDAEIADIAILCFSFASARGVDLEKLMSEKFSDIRDRTYGTVDPAGHYRHD